MTPGQILHKYIYPFAIYGESRQQDFWERAAQTVLDSQWRSVDDPPTNTKEKVLLCGGYSSNITDFYFNQRNTDRTHWMPIPKLPKPKELTPLEKFNKEFEEKFKNSGLHLSKRYIENVLYYDSGETQNMWDGWQAAKGL